MKLSIRTRLTLLISAVFFCVLGLLLISGGMALYMGFTEEIDQTRPESVLRSLDRSVNRSDFFEGRH